MPYLHIAILFYSDLSSRTFKKLTVGRLISNYCWIHALCLTTDKNDWMLLCCIKIICFNNSIRSYQPISHIFEFTNSQSTLLMSFGIARTYFIAIKANFKLFYVPSTWMSSGSTVLLAKQRTIQWNWSRCYCSFRTKLTSFFVLLQFIK